MRRHCLQESVKRSIVAAYLKSAEEIFSQEADDAFQNYLNDGGSPQDWEYEYELDEEYVKSQGQDFAVAALSKDPKKRRKALKEIDELDIDLEISLGEAYSNQYGTAFKHEEAVKELEKRRREVMRDYEALQRLRPIDVEVVSE